MPLRMLRRPVPVPYPDGVLLMRRRGPATRRTHSNAVTVRADRIVFGGSDAGPAAASAHGFERYAVSNALALSVRLAMWEKAVEDFIAGTQQYPSVRRAGRGQSHRAPGC